MKIAYKNGLCILPEQNGYIHMEENSHAHIKPSLMAQEVEHFM